MDAVAKEQWALALLTARFDCAQQAFFQAEYGRRRRSPAVALALCLLLGAFGAHEFYLGRLRSAALRLLFCWTLIPLALALAEAPFLTRRVHVYNTRMAHTLAEIVAESFAAVRKQTPMADQPVAPAQSSWQVGVARTFAPPPAMRWRPEAPPTTPLAEEHLAPEAASAAPHQAPSLSPDATQPAFTYSAVLPWRERARLGPSLDTMLAGLTALADDTATQRSSQPSPAPVVLPATERIARVAPTTMPIAQPVAQPVAASETLEPDDGANDVEASASSGEDYAKMMATDKPPAAIMGAGPASVAVTAPVAPVAPVAPARFQRIIVRKVALVDGSPIAEARAMRDVLISGSDADVEARIVSATDEARVEAMSLLAAMVPAETLAQEQGA